MVLGALGTVHAGIARWLDQVTTTCSTYRKQCFWDPLGSFVKSCLPLFKGMIWSKYPRGRVCFRYVLAIDLTNQTDLVEHNKKIIRRRSHRRAQWLATMAATPWFEGSNPSDDIEL